MFAMIEAGKVSQYPLDEREIRAAHPNVSFSIPFSPPHPYVRVWPTAAPELPWNETAVEYVPAFRGGIWRQSWQSRPLTAEERTLRLETLRRARLSALASRRWAAETGGMLFEGSRFATDEAAQTKYVGALLACQQDPQTVLQWKTADGEFLRLDAPAVLRLVSAIRQHIQHCFDLEALRTAQIDAAADPGELARIDIESGW